MRNLLTKPTQRYRVKKDGQSPSSLFLFNEAGTPLRDEIGGYHMTLQDPATGSWELSQEGLAFYHGAGAIWENASPLGVTGYPFSVITRIKMPQNGLAQTFWSIGDSGSTDQISQATAANGDYRMTGIAGTLHSGFQIDDDQWHTCGVVVDSALMTTYLDGVAGNSATPGAYSSNIHHAYLGNRANSSTNQPFIGRFAFCAVYNRALSASEFAEIG